MKRLVSTLGVLLGISVLINSIVIVRLRDRKTPSPSGRTRLVAGAQERPLAEATANLSTDAKIDRLIVEMDRLRAEVSAVRREPQQSTTERESFVDSPVAPSSPRASEVVREGSAAELFWDDVRKISEVRESTEEGEYLPLVLERTVEFLAIPSERTAEFVETGKSLAAESDRVYREFAEGSRLLAYDPANPQAYMDAYQALYRPVEEMQKRAKDRLAGFLLPANPRHRYFAKKLSDWLYFLAPEAAEDSAD